MISYKTKLIAAITIWVLMIGVGSVWVMDFASRPGDQVASPELLPTQDLRSRSEGMPTLVVFVHPHCSCSKATLNELARMVTFTKGLADIHILFYKPPGKEQNWVESPLWDQAKEIIGAKVYTAGDQQITRFGALTSGQTLLYDANDKLIFSGGLTAGRSHEGDNLGHSSIKSYLLTGETAESRSPVFGCALTSEHVLLGRNQSGSDE